jgi:hypothetical protein
MTGVRRLAGLVAWIGALVVALVLLHGLGGDVRYQLPRHDVAGWIEQVGPAASFFALLRVVALGCGGYLLAVTAAALVLRVVRADAWALAVERCAPRLVGQLVRAAVGASLVASSLSATTTVSAAQPTPDPSPPITMHRLRDGAERGDASTDVVHPYADSGPTVDDGSGSIVGGTSGGGSGSGSIVGGTSGGGSGLGPIAGGVSAGGSGAGSIAGGTSAGDSGTSVSGTSGRGSEAASVVGGTSDGSGAVAPSGDVAGKASRQEAPGSTAGHPGAGPAGALPRITMRRLADAGATSTAESRSSDSAEPHATAGGPDPAPAPRPEPPSDEAPAVTMHRAAAPAEQHEPDAWVVRPGDHLWRIAEETLARAWGRAPSDREIDPFWRRLVERNRSALHDPANPDLLFPGDRIEVPAAPPPA